MVNIEYNNEIINISTGCTEYFLDYKSSTLDIVYVIECMLEDEFNGNYKSKQIGE